MILQDKTSGKKVLIELEDISLEHIKQQANFICRPNQPLNERNLIVSFPSNNEDEQKLVDKIVYNSIEEATKNLHKDKLMGGIKLTKGMRFSQAYIQELGNIEVKSI